MTSARLQDYRVLRMMYWTTTGVAQNIKGRNREMWQPKNLKEFLTAWDAGVSNVVVNHAPHPVGAGGGMAAANQIRNYFPNVIMIDFADPTKCDLIFNLNQLTTGQINRGMTLIAKRARV